MSQNCGVEDSDVENGHTRVHILLLKHLKGCGIFGGNELMKA